MDLNLTEIIPIISAIVPLLPIPYLYHRREIHKSYYSVTWKLSKYLKPSDLLAERPFEKYYETRDFDSQIADALKEHQNFLIRGPPLAGKSRAIYEALKMNDESFDILIPKCREINPDSFVLPYRARFWRKGVVILDDLQRLVEQRGFEYLLREVINRRYIIIASSRTGEEFNLVEGKFAGQSLHLDSLFHEHEIEILPIDGDTAKKIARNTHRDWAAIGKGFNGTIGSIFMKLEEMKKRFDSASNDEKTILRAIQKLYRCGVFQDLGTFPVDWARKMVSCDDTVWNQSIEALQLKEFIKMSKEGIRIEPVYIEEIITPFPETEPRVLCHELTKTFENDPHILWRIGNRLQDIGKYDLNIADFMTDAVILYRKILDNYSGAINSYNYAVTQNSLGNAYGTLADVEEKAENCRRAIEAYQEALKIYTIDRFPVNYAITQNNLGAAYQTLADVEEKAENSRRAIEAYQEALKIFTIDRFPVEYAMTQHNLGNAYRTLALVEERAENCRRAIEAFQEALKIRTIDRFPMDYAVTQNSLGTAYGTLALVEERAENCRRAIEAFQEALKIRTIDRFPMDFAMTQNNLGTAYGTLALVEEKAENCRRAIEACQEALKIYTIDRFPMDFAMTQSNLGAVYRTLAVVEERAENCRRAIEACQEALKIYTIDWFPMDFAMAQHNLGAAYRTLAEVEERAENCRRAIEAYQEALKIYTIDRFPMDFAMTQNNLGAAYGTLAEVEEKAENCRRAIEAYQEALKIFTIDRFPMQFVDVKKNVKILQSICGNYYDDKSPEKMPHIES